ncbi:MAG: enolase C-terminal domain-like protein [bacterium]
MWRYLRGTQDRRPCCSVSSSLTLHASSTGILLAASLHLAASLPNLDSVEYHMFHQWLFDKCPPNAFKPDAGGFVRPPDGPGFGLEIHYDDL